jgi:CheY-like chemotaxis protein
VLIVEDYAPNVLVATLMLEEMGYEAEAAESGIEALERLTHSDTHYHAILMDVQMHEMDGFETTRRIRDLEPVKGFRYRIIGVTAHALAGDRERCIEAGMDDYLSKPIQPGLLAQKLRDLARV